MTQMMQRAVPPFQSTYPGVLNDYLIAQQLPGGKDDKLTAAAKEQQQQLLLASLQGVTAAVLQRCDRASLAILDAS